MDDRILSIVPSRNVVGPGAKFICVESCVVTTFRDFSKRSLRTVIKTGLAVGLMGVTMPDLIGPAQAQWERPRPEPQIRATNRKTQTKAVPAPVLARTPEAGSPLLALVSIGAQRLDIYDRKGLVASSPISSGRTGHERRHEERIDELFVKVQRNYTADPTAAPNVDHSMFADSRRRRTPTARVPCLRTRHHLC